MRPAMIDSLLALDEAFFLFLNGLHQDWLDPIMFAISGKLEWIPLYLFIIIRLIYKYKQAGLIALVALIITIILTDQVTSGFMKPFFGRLRPTHDPELSALVHIINGYRGGLYSFASSHASNSFALVTFLWLTLRHRERWVGYLFIWASIVAYSRIYLGVHFPADVIVGALVGILMANLVFKVYEKLIARYQWPGIER
ncbi:phosphatase PAP2 family protein [Fulvivirgaceae bacterium BMA12]|uniref:Phosphatase PAP2 family protein n=1 Tax=Agaribacillus aureus TaxID=3051825 RepID=A0ABT8L871_9BACT|nr:phosphatase PAP2 family protein [Fulvivirgaceae bacterium BMA12]